MREIRRRRGPPRGLTSAIPAPSAELITADHLATERALAASGLSHTILRNDLYADLVLGALPAVQATGVLADARGDGAAGFVTREDCEYAVVSTTVADLTGTPAQSVASLLAAAHTAASVRDARAS